MYVQSRRFSSVFGAEDMIVFQEYPRWLVRRASGEELAAFADSRLPETVVCLQRFIADKEYGSAAMTLCFLGEELWWLRAVGAQIRTLEGQSIGEARTPELAEVIAQAPDTLDDLYSRHLMARFRPSRSGRRVAA
jgi:hypothetical protein